MSFLSRRRFVSVIGRKSAVPDGLWMKCPACKKAVYRAEVEQNLSVCPLCGHHSRLSARQRIETIADPGTFAETHADVESDDPLGFSIGEVNYSYRDKVIQAKQKSLMNEAMVTGFAAVEGSRTVLAAMDFTFRGGSMGSAVGEKFCRAASDAVRERVPLIALTSSGGARMEEGILSLMQMAKTADAVLEMNEAGVPYIVVLTDPTTGGVYASFASLGDITLAEPNAHIGFAGPRLIEGALKVKLPEGFQSAEYQFANGFIDQIVKRSELRPLLGKLLRYLTPQ
ncbi:MAG TPA: acetyl-CoA carboxylase, carboxyltransferase subunit beta [Candidatus Hydrogenedentes bacterium]|nr:acetyl-CoA carboxylase, carboxyltransferase subunit beta [Candidatus Hydrogenedentota bacterium]HOS03052.1 acetyl-CoA carboxylase, carboxyltransferase subunit beta [Candidatus Hydrogenedentota bacterium]